MKERMETCRSCRYFIANWADEYNAMLTPTRTPIDPGTCHRHPPVPVANSPAPVPDPAAPWDTVAVRSPWPTVFEHEGCGDWARG